MSYRYLDTGAMYRAVTYYMLQNNISADEPTSVEQALEHIKIDFTYNPDRSAADTILNGENVEEAIRTMRISRNVSQFAALKSVRQEMVAQQQAIGRNKKVVLDGRDIGTVVFPNADVKIFMTASVEIRAKRRLNELQQKGQNATLAEVQQNLEERDHLDSTRVESPLKQAQDAKVLDNSNLDPTAQLKIALDWAKEAMQSTT